MSRETHTLTISVTVDGTLDSFSVDEMADAIRPRVFDALRDYESDVQGAGTVRLSDPTFEIVIMEVSP
jgi:hypothetical protein